MFTHQALPGYLSNHCSTPTPSKMSSEVYFLATRTKLWSAFIAACLLALVAAAVTSHQSFRLTAFCDVLQCLLLLSGALSFLPRILSSQGRIRLFWTFISLGAALWFVYQVLWTYIEVVARQEVPDPFSGDIVMFLHLVPMMAAIAVRPHTARDEYGARVGRLDFALLTLWWIYLYALSVLPWQYVVSNEVIYSHNLNALYLVEKIVFLGALAIFFIRSRGSWRSFYANLFGASLLYAASSNAANWALARNLYYTGSLYDIPLAVSMAWLTFIGLWSRVEEPKAETRPASSIYGVWVARCGMIAAISLPLFAGWILLDTGVPPGIRSFRLILTLVAALAMGVMAFVRQRLLDRELLRLLDRSRDSLDNLKRLQAQFVQSAKQASIGQLVGGAAHELNNPITAMLGYSELLLNTQLTPEQHTLAAKIAQQVRRTRSLVASLLSFARQRPATRTPIDVNTLLRTSVKLAQPQWQALKMEVRLELDGDLPKVLGDSNQLMQVCLQILGNALHRMDERGGRTLTIRSRRQADHAVFEISEDAPAILEWVSTPGTEVADGRVLERKLLEKESPEKEPAKRKSAEGKGTDADDALGLSACRGIVQEHFGRVIAECRPDGGNVVRIELPSNPLPDPASPMRSSVLLAQSRPSA
jgi:signal transduction histidine kinase